MTYSAVTQYEQLFSKVNHVPTSLAFWKGRTALYAILKALGIGPDDEVLMPGFTCVVVPNAVRFVGATPVYVDISPNSYNIDPGCVEQQVTSNTRALIVQHTFGIPADLDPLMEIAEKYRLAVIEDCAHSLGSSYGERPIGTFGQAAFFSSQWSKLYTTGLGGIATTGDAALAKRLHEVAASFRQPKPQRQLQLGVQYALYRRFFSPRLYWFAITTLHRLSHWNLFVGSSSNDELSGIMPPDARWRMSSYQAKIGIRQLADVNHNLAHRCRLARFYEDALRQHGWKTPQIPQQARPAYLRYPLCVANKWELLYKAVKARVELGSWFESVLHPIQSSLERFGYRSGQCPVAERIASEVVNLPLHPRISVEDAQRVVAFIFREAKMSSPVN